MVQQAPSRHYKDRFSHYFDPAAFGRFQDVTEGSFSGVGLSAHQAKAGSAGGDGYSNGLSRRRRQGIRSQATLSSRSERHSIAGRGRGPGRRRIKGRRGQR